MCFSSQYTLMTATELVVSAGGSVSLVGEPPSLPPLTMATKAESVASVTSQCSFSSTIVHVGDKKPPESGGNHQHSHSLNPYATQQQVLACVKFNFSLKISIFFLLEPYFLCWSVTLWYCFLILASLLILKKKKLTTKCFYYFKSPKNYLAETCKPHDKTADCR